MHSTVLAVDAIRIDGGTQPRSRIDESVVGEYAEAMREGTTFPPVVVFHDGVDNWLADGFHRVHAARHAGSPTVAAEVHPGTKRDAILYSVSANATHGSRRTNEDKRKAVQTLLNDPEWLGWTTSEQARQCKVSRWLVEEIKGSLAKTTSEISSERKYTTKHGTVSMMRTENIGKRDTGKVDANGRKIVIPAGKKPREERAEEIRALVKKGYSITQIADETGTSAGNINAIAKDYGIELIRVVGTFKKVDSHRVIEQTVLQLESSAASMHMIRYSVDDIDPVEAADWVESMTESLRVFTSLRNQLKERSHVQDAA